MSKPSPSIEAFLRHLREEAHEVAEQILDHRQRAMVLAFMAATLIEKVAEGLPEMKVTDASEARELVEEAEGLLQATLDALREHGADARATGPGLGPSAN